MGSSSFAVAGFVPFLSAFAASFFALWLIARRPGPLDAPAAAAGDDPAVFLFDDRRLIDATPRAEHLLATAAGGAEDDPWTVMDGFLRTRFEGVDLGAPPSGHDVISRDGTLSLSVSLSGPALRLEIAEGVNEAPAGIDRQGLDALEAELTAYRQNSAALPYLVWRESADGMISWVSPAYLDLVEAQLGADAAGRWPPERLFQTRGFLPRGDSRAQGRLTARQAGQAASHWFDIRAERIGSEVLFTAADATQAVRAETQLREYTQTLAKTFAHLTVGLAIFDRSRRLVLFNPALSDLTTLSPEFLSSRPPLAAFLDRLREKQMIPEPSDYQEWRNRLTALETAAARGTYAETWSLPAGQTYRVAGRPHPDGAVAFLFEDISAEISLTRRFRSEIELSQTVIDALPDAIAVFAGDGTLAITNEAYDALWGGDAGQGMAAASAADASRSWMARSAPNPVWGDFRDFCHQREKRAEWTAEVRLTDGRALGCRFVPLTGGATMAIFTPGPPGKATLNAEAGARRLA